MSFEQDPYEREDEEIRKAFAAKDAEIECLKQEIKDLRRELARPRRSE